MKLFTKQHFIDLAEVSDAWRTTEKIMLFGYGFWNVTVLFKLSDWYFYLQPAERTTEVSLFCGAVIAAVTGFSAPIFNTYNNARRDWAAMRQTTTTISTSETTK